MINIFNNQIIWFPNSSSWFANYLETIFYQLKLRVIKSANVSTTELEHSTHPPATAPRATLPGWSLVAVLRGPRFSFSGPRGNHAAPRDIMKLTHGFMGMLSNLGTLGESSPREQRDSSHSREVPRGSSTWNTSHAQVAKTWKERHIKTLLALTLLLLPHSSWNLDGTWPQPQVVRRAYC